MLANTAFGVAPFACQQASHGGFVARSVGDQLAGEYGVRGCPIRLPASFPQRLRGTICGRPACWRIRPPPLPHSLASKLPTAALWHDLWETSLLANTASGVAPFACQQASHSGFVARSVGDQLAGEYGLRGCPIRLPASFPQRLRGTIRGRPACWRIRPSGLPHSLASKLPAAALWHDPWETSSLANTAFGVAPFACQQASRGGFVARSVGDQLAGEYGLRRCPIRLPASFPRRLRSTIRGRPACWRIRPPALPHSLASKLPTAASWHDPWETSLLANSGLRRCPIRLQGAISTWAPTAISRHRCPHRAGSAPARAGRIESSPRLRRRRCRAAANRFPARRRQWRRASGP